MTPRFALCWTVRGMRWEYAQEERLAGRVGCQCRVRPEDVRGKACPVRPVASNGSHGTTCCYEWANGVLNTHPSRWRIGSSVGQ